MHIYRLERRVSHADVDFLGELKVSAWLGLFEQAAIEASIDAGFDAEWYMRAGGIWIIHRTRYQRLAGVGGGDRIAVQTHLCDVRRVRSLRRYAAHKAEVEVAHATTDWVYCDVVTGRPARVPEPLQTFLLADSARVALPRAASLRAVPPPEAVDLRLTVQPSHLDHVLHVNNAVYANFLEDGAFALFAAHGWPLPRMLLAGGALRIEWLDAEHRSDAQAGEELIVRSWLPAGAPFPVPPESPHALPVQQLICRLDGSEVVCAASQWVWRRKPAVVGGAPI